MVTQIHFITPTNNYIEAIWADGSTIQFEWPLTGNIKPAPVPSERDPNPTDYWKYPREVKEWLDAGNIPVAYNPDYGLSAEEITERDEKAAIAAEFASTWSQFSAVERALLRAAFRHENQIRVLNGQAQLTKADFATWVENNT